MKLAIGNPLVVTALLLLSGCGGGGVESVHKTQGVTISVKHAGHNVTSTGKSADGVDSWTADGMTYGLDHMHVMLNGKDYGEVKAGDSVEIEEAAGKVTVNGKQRTPQN